MKKMIFAFAVLAGLSAQAQTAPKDIISCVVPVQNGTPTVSINVSAQFESNADFVMFTLKDKDTTTTLFSQTEKGQVAEELKNGGLSLLVLTESFAQENGVLKNAGFFAIGKNDDGTVGGILSALGNVYPLSCQLK